MSDPRVGVASANATMIVALSLQGHGFDTFRVTDLSALEKCDVALVDLAPAETLEVVRAAEAQDVPCVAIADEPGDVPGARVVLRPYSMAELVSTLQEALRARATPSLGDVDLEEAGSGAPDPMVELPAVLPSHVEAQEGSTAGPYEGGVRRWGRRLLRSGTPDGLDSPAEGNADCVGEPASVPLVPDGLAARHEDEPGQSQGPLDPEDSPTEGDSLEGLLPRDAETVHEHVGLEDPISRVESTAETLQALLADAPFLKSPAHFADGIARALAADLHALNVGLWTSVDDELGLLGGVGLTPGERRMRPSTRHPLIEQSRSVGGLVLEGTEMGALVHGVAGARTNIFAVVLIEDRNMPVSIVTVGADTMAPDLVRRVEAFVIETSGGWRAVQAVQKLRFSLPD